jgi:hypothetical protein
MIGLSKATRSQSEMRDVATRVCREYLSGAWKNISSDEIQVKRMSGGLSNFLYYVSLPNNSDDSNTIDDSTISTKRTRKESYHNIMEPTKVLLRIYGQSHGENALENMLTESVVFALLSERQLGPKLHGIFPGGRIEQYIPVNINFMHHFNHCSLRFPLNCWNIEILSFKAIEILLKRNYSLKSRIIPTIKVMSHGTKRKLSQIQYFRSNHG